MAITLTANNYFSTYISDPFSNDLSTTGKLIATISTVVLSILTVGLIIPIVSYIRCRDIKPIAQPLLQQTRLKENVEQVVYGILKTATLEPRHLEKIFEIYPTTNTLKLSTSNLTKEHLEELANLKDLTSLTIERQQGTYDNESMTDDQLALFLPSLTKLQSLVLQNHDQITGKTFNLLPKTLTALLVRGKVNDKAVSLLNHLDNLDLLILSSNTEITGSTFMHLPKSLTTLSVNVCNVNDSGVTNLKGSTKLQRLDLSGNKAISDKSLNQLPPSIIDLDLAHCNVTSAVYTNLKHLTHLSPDNLKLPYHIKKA